MLLVIISMAMMSCEEVEINPISDVPSPVEGINYYRLKQVDFDGTESYHDIMSTQVVETSNANINARTLGVSETSAQSGSWDNGSTWNSGSSLGFSLGNDVSVTISDGHTVTASQNIILGKDSQITVEQNATLDLVSYDISKDGQLNVEAGAVLIIRGDFDANKNLVIDTKGIVIVMGSINIAKDAEIKNSGSLYFADPSPNIDPSVNWSGAAAGDMNDLANDFPALMATLPITVAWQQATALQDGTVSIAFETSEETNSDYVVIQWSVDAESWTDITRLPSNNKPSYYEYFHR